MDFLVFTLYAPIGAHGEVAVGERRTSWLRPGRSTVLGLVAAALGVERVEEERQLALDAALGYGVRTLAPGVPLSDYHTTQTPKTGTSRSRARFVTRRQELEWSRLATVLSSRQYRSDAFYSVALWLRRPYEGGLEGMAEALRRPGFSPYLGRKASPLGLPTAPAIVEAETLPAAFEARGVTEVEADVLCALGVDADAPTEIACDRDAPGLQEQIREERRRDAIMSRTRWQFAERVEAVFSWPAASG